MIEAFERHLKQHNISKQFEEAKTKEDKIEVCKKFLEGEGYNVKSNLDPQKQMQEGERYSMVANPLVLKGGGGAGGIGTLTIDPSTVSGKLLPTWEPSTPNNPIKYLQARMKLSDDEMTLGFNDKLQMESYVLDNLTRQIVEGIRQHIIDKNLIKSEYNYATTDKLFGVKIGIVG